MSDIAVTMPNPRIRKPVASNEAVFLPMGPMTRVALLYYLFAYRLVFPITFALISPGAKDLLAARCFTECIETVLIAFPFIFYRREYGWLHPLVLPTMFDLAKAMAKNPFSLVMPFQYPLVSFRVETLSKAAVLSVPDLQLAQYRLEESLIMAFARAVYLAFFLFGPSFTIPRIKSYRPSGLTLSGSIVVGAMIACGLVFIISQGGFSAVLVGMRGGRRELFEGNGVFISIAMMAPMVALAWYAYEERPWRNLFMIGALAGSLAITLLASGSRSSMINPVIVLTLLWWRRRGRALILPMLMVAFFGLFVIGAFGAIRQDWDSKAVDLSVLDPTHLSDTMTTALDDIDARGNEEAGLAVVAGASQKGYLLGRSYLNAATFWVPRALWPNKPAGTDVYNMWINFNGNPINSRPPQIGTWGIPVGAEMEAYWNFSYFGVFFLFSFVGMLHATLAKAAHIYHDVPIFWVFYIFVFVIFSGTTKEMILVFYAISVLTAFAFTSGIFRMSRAESKLPRSVQR